MLAVDLVNLVALSSVDPLLTSLTRQRRLFIKPLAINNTLARYSPEKNHSELSSPNRTMDQVILNPIDVEAFAQKDSL